MEGATFAMPSLGHTRRLCNAIAGTISGTKSELNQNIGFFCSILKTFNQEHLDTPSGAKINKPFCFSCGFSDSQKQALKWSSHNDPTLSDSRFRLRTRHELERTVGLDLVSRKEPRSRSRMTKTLRDIRDKRINPRRTRSRATASSIQRAQSSHRQSHTRPIIPNEGNNWRCDRTKRGR
ncbi:hypothetical protein EVAR_96426_1 [Eumeta japonica]|uniref:Uncharacterized protein n=1 Tax=Eumeta variegata TaxID=151549 RepID=A0A4C1WE01_EUMVA|nr:hypothetical protein EVAR_96426_1 [Eumeta japonica]